MDGNLLGGSPSPKLQPRVERLNMLGILEISFQNQVPGLKNEATFHDFDGFGREHVYVGDFSSTEICGQGIIVGGDEF